MNTLIDVRRIARISREESSALAAHQYDRFVDELRHLAPEDWTCRTDCPDWDVRQMAAHVLGACDSCASIREQMQQVRRGRKWAEEHGRPDIDGINAVQVADRDHLTPQQILDRLGEAMPKAVRGRAGVPGLMRRINVGDGSGGPMTLGWLVEVIYTRDTFMHRVDVARATGRLGDLELTAEQDGRLVADVVAQWAGEHGKAFTLTLDGPAGGHFVFGEGGVDLHLDAVEFMRTLSGRAAGEGLLAHTVLF